MPTKTLKFTLQAEPSAEQDVGVLIKVDNVTVFNQAVPSIGPVQPGIADPSEFFTFDLDVAYGANVGNTETRNFSITAQNGTAKIENISCNFSAIAEQQGNVWNLVAGDANNFVVCNIVSQPMFNGEVITSRYDIEYNNGPIAITGPGEVLVFDGENAVFDVAVWAFNDSNPGKPS